MLVGRRTLNLLADIDNMSTTNTDPVAWPRILPRDEQLRELREEGRRLFKRAKLIEKQPQKVLPPAIIINAANQLMGALNVVMKPQSAQAVMRIVEGVGVPPLA